MLRLIDYQPKHKAIFKSLSEEWIKKYMPLIDHDKDVINDPEGQILAKGGEIIFAVLDGQIVGTAALTKKSDTHYELSKLAVTEKAKGQGIGKMLTEEIIKRARAKELKQLYLASNQALTVAIQMYTKMGFVMLNKAHATPQCDIHMVLTL